MLGTYSAVADKSCAASEYEMGTRRGCACPLVRTGSSGGRLVSGSVARTWLQIRVDLEGGGGIECEPPPGRIFIVGPGHSFAQLAEAIDASFGRWDLSHLHVFELPDKRQVGFADVDDPGVLSHDELKVATELKPGEAFTYVFDLGDDWRHRCRVLADKLDPTDEYGPGPLPNRPVPIWGWGWIPDQYGRESAEELDLEG